MDNFQIGQVVYLLTSSESGLTVHPVVVYEKILHQRIDGTTVSWKLMVGPKAKNKVIDSTKIEGELYDSIDKVKEVTVNRWVEYIDGVLEKAEKTAVDWYGDIQNLGISGQPVSDKISVEKLIAQDAPNSEPSMEVKLPDGRTTTAR
jgi:hypothetical protein